MPAFLEACCIRKADGRCVIQDIYRSYKVWASEAGFTLVQNQLNFRRNLEHLGYPAKRGTGGYQTVYGLILKR